jgi:hypothetical protein
MSERGHALTPHGTASALGRLEVRITQLQQLFCFSGLLGLATVMLVSIPGNYIFDVNPRRHQLAGMLFSHASVLALLIGLSPRRERLLERARVWRSTTWLSLALPSCLVFIAAWMALYSALPSYATSLARESGPLEPLQAGLYVTASWLAFRSAAQAGTEERRFFRAVGIVCVWLALEEVEYFGVFEMLVGGRIHGVWVRAVHDFIALGVKVAAVRMALIGLAVATLGLGIWWVGLRSVLRQVRSVAAVPGVLAVATLALSQVLDQDNSALAGYSRLLAYRLEEPLELVTATLITVTSLIRYGELARPATGKDTRPV